MCAGRDAHAMTDAAVVEGIGRTDRFVSRADLELFFAVVSLSRAPNTGLPVLTTDVGAGILLDAAVVRVPLAMALVATVGRCNGAPPARLVAVLGVAPSPDDGARAVRPHP